MSQLEFIYQDDFLFAVNKPPTLHSVGIEAGGGPSVADLLLDLNPSLKLVSDKELDAGLVHRLDLSTSGVLLGAKTRECWLSLRAAMDSSVITKNYLILCEGEFSSSCRHSSWIGNERRGSAKVKSYAVLPRASRGYLLGETSFSPVKYIASLDLSIVVAQVNSARRHQVRVHAADLGTPLIGDLSYGSKRPLSSILDKFTEFKVNPARSFFLHASKLHFVHPISRLPITIEAEPR